MKGSSLSTSAEDTASPMVPRRIDKNVEEEDAARTGRRIE